MAGTSHLEAARAEAALWIDEPRIVVALSGGADSAALAAACRSAGIETRACFADHGLEHSARLGDAAAAIAEKLAIEFAVVAAPVPDGPSLEAQARSARYAALEAAAEGALLATAHTADDQAETILGSLLRGSGTTGLSGIPRRRGRWVRPFLSLRRAAVRAVADELDLPYWDDPGNVDMRHRRNVTRRELPGLAQRFNPDLIATLNRTAELLGHDDDALSALAADAPLTRDDGAVLIPAPLLAVLPQAVASRVVRRGLRLAHPPYPGIAADVATVLEVASGRSRAAEITGGYRVEREGPMVAIYAVTPPINPAPAELAVPGRTRFGAWSLSAGPANAGRHDRWAAVVAQAPQFTVRAAEIGERIDIGQGSKPVREAMAEAGIPARKRAGWPVVAAGGRIVWLVGGRRAAWAKPEAAPAVLLTAERTRT